MLQPRRRKLLELACLLLVGFCLQLVSCDLGGDGIGAGRVRAERAGRDENDVNTVLILDNDGRNGRYLATAVPVVTSTVRTFVQEGTTTEYATHVIGTRLDKGKLYASVVGTSSRVYYDTHLPRYSIENQILPTHLRSVIRPTAHIVYPVKDTRIPFNSLKSGSDYQTSNKREPLSGNRHELYQDYKQDSLEEAFLGPIHHHDVESDLHSHDSVVKFSSQSSSSKHVEKKPKGTVDDDEEDNYLESRNQDLFNKRHVDESTDEKVNPAQVVKSALGLPTFTIKHDFAPSGFSADFEETTEGKKMKEIISLRGGKALYRNGVKTDNRKLDTVTYRGFADFTTTVGDTVIIFMPNTVATEPSKATDALKEASSITSTEEPIRVVTKMKTFYSHTPGMQTKTVTGHSLSMQTSLPTHLVLPESGIRRPKTFPDEGAVYVVDAEAATEPAVVQEDPSPQPKEEDAIETPDVIIEPSVVAVESSMESLVPKEVGGATEQLPPVVGSSTSFFPTVPEPVATYATTRTQVLAAADQKEPLGLVKVLGGTRAFNSTTTVFTELIYGTIIDGTYSQVIHSKSSVFYEASTATPETTTSNPETTTESDSASTFTENLPTTNNADLTTNPVELTTEASEASVDTKNEVETGRKIQTRPQDQFIVDNDIGGGSVAQNTSNSEPSSTDSYLTRVVPSTVYKTFTYLTTFFIPDGTLTTTSVRSREVTSSEINLVTRVINGNVNKPNIIPTITSSVQEKLMTKPVEVLSDIIQPLTANTPSEKEITTPMQDIKTTTENSMQSEKTTDMVTELEKTTTEKLAEEVVTTEMTTKEEQVITTESVEITVTTPTPTTLSEPEEEEIDLIFKTLYTTYTYLTTFFQESTTSVSSREVVVTNIVTSTLDNDFFLKTSETAVSSSINNEELSSKIMPTSVGIGRPTTRHFSEVLNNSDDPSNDSENNPLHTPVLDLEHPSLSDSVTKTFYTTYTYFTTIFVDGETTVSSRTEVYTNVVTPSMHIVPSTPIASDVEFTKPVAAEYFDQVEAPQSQVQVTGVYGHLSASHIRTPVLKSTPHYAYSSTISRNRFSSPGIQSSIVLDDDDDNNISPKHTTKIPDGYATISRPHANDASAAAFEGTTSRNTESEDEREGAASFQELLTSEEPNMDMKAAVLAHEQGGLTTKGLPQESEKISSSMTEPTVTEQADSKSVPEIQVRHDTFVAADDIDPLTVSGEQIIMKTMAMVTDITSSSSGGNAVADLLDDQISSESNTEEIEPSPTLLLQTSFTTFTYFTTVYKGSTSSEVISRLETVTNVVTETLSPMRSSVVEEDSTLPITYFTTFTYWTTLYRDGNTVVTSREETVSNIITPTVTVPPVLITATPAAELIEPSKERETSAEIEASVVEPRNSEPTTFYTTYTYFTTSYIGNSTVLNSRLETVTNIINETDDQTARAVGTSVPEQLIVDQITKTDAALLPTGLLSTIFTSEVQDGTTTFFSTDVYGTYIDGLYAKILESSTQIVTDMITPSSTVKLQPTGVVSLNEGKIVDADGISTTYFTTRAIGTYIEQLYAQVIESTSSVKVDEEKKTALPEKAEGEKNLKTGLVRLIEGSIVKDDTTTFYESKVVGTVIDGRYAQIIESTSSFKVGMPSTKLQEANIMATKAVSLDQAVTGTSVLTTAPTSAVIESSLGEEGTDDKEDEDDESEEEDEDDEDSDGNPKKSKKSRLTFSTRKRTFTPVIRPFASRNRPTFNPRRKTDAASSATTITRTTLTPTITATPAAKTSEGRGRFASNRRQSSALNEIRPTVSSSRRFSRVRGSTPGVGAASFSSPTVSRLRSTSRVFPTAASSLPGSSRRAGFQRSSSTRVFSDSPIRSTSGASNSRFRIRPTSSGFGRGASTAYTTPSAEDQFSPEDNDITTLVTEETPGFTEDEQDSPTQPISTTTESSRRTNPLLRFRRPPTLRAQPSTSRPSTTSAPRKNLLRSRTSDANNNGNRITTTTTSTTQKPPPSFNSRFKNLSNRARPSNSLFPRRGLLKKPDEEIKEEPKSVVKEEDALQNEDEQEEIDDNDYEGTEVDEAKTVETPRRGKLLSPQIRPFVGFQRRRSKRQISEYGTRRETTLRPTYNNNQQRFRRPTARTQPQVQDRYDYVDEEAITETPKTKQPGRFTPRPRSSQQTEQKIRPTTVMTNTVRSQFTLREKQTTPRTNFRRPTTPSPRRRPPTTKDTTSRAQPKTTRLRPQTNAQTDASQLSRTSSRRYTNANANSRRPQSRSRSRGDTVHYDTYTQPSFDGTITVTHRIPTEVTIPIVNGKVTEYRNVITASPSTEVLGPHQYTSTAGKDGNTLLVLTSEVTGTLPGGVTEVTQYLLHETPTTSVTFTPTVIRGRKTSFSHVVPSTVYEVERLVSTIQPQLSPNAPLANILLSQLLLGNLNLAQPNMNPLLGLNTAATQATPVTEYKTRATTYVTTVTKGGSTVVPLTFRGKEILTTIFDTSLETITATEFLTDTIVTTPTVAVAPNQQQLNSLLLPALLQLQSQGQQNNQNPLFGLQQIQEPKIDQIIDKEETTRGSQKRRKPEDPDRQIRDSDKEYDDEEDTFVAHEEPPVSRFKQTRKKPSRGQVSDRKPPDPPPNPPATSVITLYVSGRRPGEFSTVLSTVVVDDDSSPTIKKREVVFAAPDLWKVESSILPDLDRYFPGDQEYLENTIMFTMNDVPIESSLTETQSLESIVGDVSKYNIVDKLSTGTTKSPELVKTDIAVESSTKNDNNTGHFLSKGPAEFAPLKRKVVIASKGGEVEDSKTIMQTNLKMAYSRKDKYLTRNKRNTDNSEYNDYDPVSREVTQPRKRVRVRVPIARRVPDRVNHQSVSQSDEQNAKEVAEANADNARHQSNFGLRRIKVIRGESQDQSVVDEGDQHRKRIVIRRRKPVNDDRSSDDIDVDNRKSHLSYAKSTQTDLIPSSFSYTELNVTPSHHRRKVTVTKKRPVSVSSSIPTTSSSHRRRVIVTKKRPVISPSEITPTHSMMTLYSYMYSEMNHSDGEPMVRVSQVFMSGNIPPEVYSRDYEEDLTTPNTNDETISEEYSYVPSDELQSPTNLSQIAQIETSFEDNLHSQNVTLPSQLLNEQNTPYLEGLSEKPANSTVEGLNLEQSAENQTDRANSASQAIESTGDASVSLPSSLEQSSEAEDSTTFDGPRFIRPTRFSITRKPSRAKASFPGGRRKTVESQSSTSTIATSNTSTRSGFRSTTIKPSRNRFTTPDLIATPTFNSIRQSSKSYRPNKSKTYGTNIAVSIPPSEIVHEFDTPIPDLVASSELTEKLADQNPTELASTNTEHTVSPTSVVQGSEVNLFVTRLVTRTRLRTYTYVVTRVAGTEEVVMSSTEVKPHVTTVTLTQSLPVPVPDIQGADRDDRAMRLAEARYNLATKVMSNGVEVIVAGDKSTLPGEPEILRLLTSAPQRPTTLAASTLTDHMMMFLPQKDSQTDLSSSLHGNKFVTKTYKTTYTYMQTSIGDGTTDVSKEEHVVSNTAVEERLSSTPSLNTEVTLLKSPVLTTGVFHTTYTFYNTVLDDDVPLVVTSTQTIDNTVTAPAEKLTQMALKETNTYLTTVDFTKTVTEGGVPQILSTKNVLTQKVVTQASHQTDGLDKAAALTTDVVKTYFVTYTYLNTYLEDGNTVVSSDVSVSTDIVTEKFYVNPKRTSAPSTSQTSDVALKPDEIMKPLHLFATKTYRTTFTYFTTLLQEGVDHKTSTLVSSHTSVVQNIVTESVSPDLFGSEEIAAIRNSLHSGNNVATAMQQDGHKVKVTAMEELKPTKTRMPDEKTSAVQDLASSMDDTVENSNNNNIVTGSTIIFFDENDQIDTQSSQQATPALDASNIQPQSSKTTILHAQDGHNHGVVNPQPLTSKRPQQEDNILAAVNEFQTSVLAASTVTPGGNTLHPGDEVIMLTQSNGNISMIPVSDPVNKKPNGGTFGPGGSEIQVSDLLSLGSLGMNGLNALGPVINAMAGLIQSNYHDHNRRNDTATSTKPDFSYLDVNGNPRPIFVAHGDRTTPRSPIYIPVGGLADDADTAESVNLESWSDTHARQPQHQQLVQHQHQHQQQQQQHQQQQHQQQQHHHQQHHHHQQQQQQELHQHPHPQAEGGTPVVLGRPNLESPLLSDGIAISPGQVITANSDVIVGKPGLLGPRPPKIHSEKEIPAGMRPPPPPRPKRPANDQYYGPPPALDQVGHQSMNNHVGKPPPPQRDGPSPPRGNGPVRNHPGNSHQSVRDQPIRNYANVPPPPNRDHQQSHSPTRNQFQGHTPSQDHNIESDLYPPPITDNLASFHLVEHDIPLSTPPMGAGIIVHPPILNENNYINTNNPLSQEFGIFPVSSGVQTVFGGQPQANDIIHGKMPTGSHVLDSSAGQPLLVNIQPSQVANVIIKDGSSTVNNPFRDNDEYFEQSPFPVQDHGPSYGSVGVVANDHQQQDHGSSYGSVGVVANDHQQHTPHQHHQPHQPIQPHHYVIPVGSAHQTRMDPPVIDVHVVGHGQDLGNAASNSQAINVDITPGQGINVDVSPGHNVNIPVTGHVHGNEHMSPSGIVLDEPLNGRPSSNEISFGRPSQSNERPQGINDQRRPQRPSQFNGVSRPRFPPVNVNHRPGSSQANNQHQESNQISHGHNQDISHNAPGVNHGNNQLNKEQNYPYSPTVFMVPPPPPPTTHFNNQPVLIPLNSGVQQSSGPKDDHYGDDDGGDESEDDAVDSEGGEQVQASNTRPLRPGQLPIEIENASTRRPTVQPPIISDTPEVFMRPPAPQMPVSNINVHQVFDKRPTRPDNNLATFDNNQGNYERPEVFDDKNPQTQFDDSANLNNFDERQEILHQGNVQGVRVSPPTAHGRPTFEESPQIPITNFHRPASNFDKTSSSDSFDSELQSNTPRPFVKLTSGASLPAQPDVDRESVVGMSPPPEPQPFPHSPPVKAGSQRHPAVPNYRNKTRPAAPYKFEVPPSASGSPNKQSTRPQVQEILTLSETNFQQNHNQRPNNGFDVENTDRKPVHPVDIVKIKPITIRPPQSYRPKTVRPALAGVLSKEQEIVTKNPVNTFKTSVIRPKPSSTVISPALQTVVIVGKPIQSNPPSVPGTPSHRNRPSQWDGKIVGSETIFIDQVIKPTPAVTEVRKTYSTSKIASTSGKTVFGNHLTRPSGVKPTRVAGGQIINKDSKIPLDVYPRLTKQPVEIPTRYITHTKTLTVTLTETTVVSSQGRRPSTHTVVVTKIQTTTQVDTVTQIHTLVQPTEIRATSTVTTTVSASQYPPGSPFNPANYPQFPIKMITTEKPTDDANRTAPGPSADKKDADVKKAPEENDTFFVVVNDKKLSSVSVSTSKKDKQQPALAYDVKEEEVASRDETDSNNEVNRAVLLGGVLVAAPPPRHGPPSTATACRPDCSPARNELCQRVSGHMRCVCRPGFARMFPDRPCKPTYTYTLRLDLDRHGKDPLKFEPALKNTSSAKFKTLAEASREGLDRLVMQSDLRDIYHGVAVDGFQPATKKDGVLVNFYVQLSDNADEERLRDVFKKSLRTSNFSLGGTDVYADKELLQHLQAEDFDECVSSQFHDCSEHSHCFNLRGTYTCSCKEGYADLSENPLFPGRVCSAELIGCEKCHYHGTCYSRGEEQQQMCECFQWYSGENCQVNLKVLLIALVTIGALLLALLLVCAVLTCMKRGRSHQTGNNAAGFLRYRGPPRTLDKRAMIADSSSEGSIDNGPVTFLAPTHQPASSIGSKPALKGARKLSEAHPSGTLVSVGYADQRDRSLTVMIPRAKYRPVPPTSPHLTMSTFGVEENKRAIVQEQKLIGYLEHGVQVLQQDNRSMNARRKQSNVTNHSGDVTPPKKVSAPRKPSNGALVSAGFEVSAMVGRKEELDIQVAAPMGAQFPTMRTNERTVSEARSCDETTIQPPTKSFHGPSQYGSKPSSRNRDEAHTMAERDLGSTLLMPQTHLYRPDRGSDISNFDSL